MIQFLVTTFFQLPNSETFFSFQTNSIIQLVSFNSHFGTQKRDLIELLKLIDFAMQIKPPYYNWFSRSQNNKVNRSKVAVVN